MKITRVLKSVLCALFGVQHSKDAKEDFDLGNPWVYVSCGVACLVLFVIILMIVVRLVLNP